MDDILNPPSSPSSIKLDEYGLWIVGDQLFIGYGMVHTLEDVIKLCRQTAQYIHVCPNLSNCEGLSKFTKVLNMRLANVKAGSLEVTKDILSKRLRDLLFRNLERMSEISPLLGSSIEAFIATGSENGRLLAAQNRDCFKQQLLETMRDFVILLQLVKNSKPVSGPEALEEDSLRVALEWLKGNSSILSNTGFEAIRQCLREGRKLAGVLNVGIDKGELMAICSEAELTAEQCRDLYKKGMGQGAHGRTLSKELSNQLSNLRDRMIEALSRKTLDDFVDANTPIAMLEKAALIPHFKPQREMSFMENKFRFEERCNSITSNIDLACLLHMIASLPKIEAIKHQLSVLTALGPQVVWSARLLSSNPYNDILKGHFTQLKKAWLRKVEQLRLLFLSGAELRTYQKYKDSRSYVSRSIVSPTSPARQVKFVTPVPVQAPKSYTVTSTISPIQKPKSYVSEEPSWESADKDLVLAARKLAMIMSSLVYLTRNDGCTKQELLNSSEDIDRTSGIVARLTRELASECTDNHNQSSLLKFCERIPTFATQLKMVCRVKAATIGSNSGCSEDEQATEMLLENARNLMASVRETVHTAAAASINIRVAANQYNW